MTAFLALAIAVLCVGVLWATRRLAHAPTRFERPPLTVEEHLDAPSRVRGRPALFAELCAIEREGDEAVLALLAVRDGGFTPDFELAAWAEIALAQLIAPAAVAVELAQEEFGFVLRGASTAQAFEIARRLRYAVASRVARERAGVDSGAIELHVAIERLAPRSDTAAVFACAERRLRATLQRAEGTERVGERVLAWVDADAGLARGRIDFEQALRSAESFAETSLVRAAEEAMVAIAGSARALKRRKLSQAQTRALRRVVAFVELDGLRASRAPLRDEPARRLDAFVRSDPSSDED